MPFHSPSTPVRRATKTIAFTGAAGLGAVGTVTVFTITGRVYIEPIVCFCTETLEEAGATATIALGVADDTDAFIGQVNATTVALNDWWTAAVSLPGAVTSGAAAGSGATTSSHWKTVSGNIIITVGAQNVTNGTLIFDCFYTPLTDDGALT